LTDFVVVAGAPNIVPLANEKVPTLLLLSVVGVSSKRIFFFGANGPFQIFNFET
jgi:hypothetical protein